MWHRHPAPEPGLQICLCRDSEGNTVPQTTPTFTVLAVVRAGMDTLPGLRSTWSCCIGGTAANSPPLPALDTARPMREAPHPSGAWCPSAYLAMASWESLPAAWLHRRRLFKHIKKENCYISTYGYVPGGSILSTRQGVPGLRAGRSVSSGCPRAGGGDRHVTAVFSQAP